MKFLYIYPEGNRCGVIEHNDSNPTSFPNYMDGEPSNHPDKKLGNDLRELKVGRYMSDNRTNGLWVRVE